MSELSRAVTADWFLWTPLAAAVLHVFEEFVFPGGFLKWYRQYRGPAATGITKSFLWKINALLLAGCFNAGFVGHNPKNLWFWVLFAALLGSNGVWHAWATVRSRAYSPGLITGMLLYLPLASISIGYCIMSGAMTPSAWFAAIIGALYPVWSAIFHHQRSTSMVDQGE